jgi:peroxin-16
VHGDGAVRVHSFMMDLYRKATSTTYTAITQPARWLGQYDEFIIKNASAVSQIESALRSLTYIIPGTRFMLNATPDKRRSNKFIAGRFRDAEIASESRMQSTMFISRTILT